eukprot:TRINITY_DN597_c0_g1_i1.p1 TRINITY_DN597_c0_g1~~TRINITY_DN597_c0_g1_i1.p1  ORF type:complete len:341 (-),score=72.01 TRINITY_DN597_c0_g1_i1:548-1570(-)
MNVNVDGFVIEVLPSDTIWSLKWKIYHASWKSVGGSYGGSYGEFLPPDDQILVVTSDGGIELDECERSVGSYSIHEGTSISCKCLRDVGERDFRRLLRVFQHRETDALKITKVTQMVGVKRVFRHIGQLRSVQVLDSMSRRTLNDFQLMRSMLSEMRYLKALNLSGIRNTGRGMIFPIAEGLGKNTSLRELYLRSFALTPESGEIIGKVLQRNMSLVKIHLDGNVFLQDEGVFGIAKGLEKNSFLKEISMKCCGIGSEGAKQIGKMLEVNSSLVKLFVGDNGSIQDEGVIQIAKALERNSSLKELDLHCVCCRWIMIIHLFLTPHPSFLNISNALSLSLK